MIDSQAPIGVFDSGVGGLTVAREIVQLLPEEELVYIGDDGRFPYGPRPAEEVRRFARQIADELDRLGVKMIVVACNTVSALALPELAQFYSVPMLGVIEDTARYVAALSRRKKVGILATPGTVNSGAYPRAFQAIDPTIEVHQLASQTLVNLIENGNSSKPGIRDFAAQVVAPFRQNGVDVFVLGCTHYPYLTRLMTDLIGDQAQIVDPAVAVALRVQRELVERGLLACRRRGNSRFLTSGDPERFLAVGRQIYPALEHAEEWRAADEY